MDTKRKIEPNWEPKFPFIASDPDLFTRIKEQIIIYKSKKAKSADPLFLSQIWEMIEKEFKVLFKRIYPLIDRIELDGTTYVYKDGKISELLNIIEEPEKPIIEKKPRIKKLST